MNLLLLVLFSASILIFYDSKSIKLTNFAGVADNVLSIFNSFTLFILYYIISFYLKTIPPLGNFIHPDSRRFTCHVLSFTYKHSSK